MRRWGALIAAVLVVTTGGARAQFSDDDDDWQLANFVTEQQTGDVRYRRCWYATDTGFRFSFITKELFCPLYLQYNPVTNRYRSNF